MWVSKPSAVRVSGKPSTPALFTSTSTVVHRVGELAHAGQVGQIEMGHLDVARHLGGGPL